MVVVVLVVEGGGGVGGRVGLESSLKSYYILLYVGAEAERKTRGNEGRRKQSKQSKPGLLAVRAERHVVVYLPVFST